MLKIVIFFYPDGEQHDLSSQKFGQEVKEVKEVKEVTQEAKVVPGTEFTLKINKEQGMLKNILVFDLTDFCFLFCFFLMVVFPNMFEASLVGFGMKSFGMLWNGCCFEETQSKYLQKQPLMSWGLLNVL